GEERRSSWNALTPAKIDQLIGERFGRLLVLDVSKYDKAFSWYTTMCDCGNTVVVNRQRLLSGDKKSCGCLQHDVSSQPKPERRAAPGFVGFKKLLNRYKRNAERRGLSFELTDDEFRQLTIDECHYCGSEPAQKEYDTYKHSFYLYNGIDRKDNSRGYDMKNAVPCCKSCNIAKGTLSAEEYVAHCRKVVRHARRA